MEGLQTAYNSAISQATASAAKISSYAASLQKTKTIDSGIGSSSSLHSSDASRGLQVRPSSKSLSVLTCSKLCAVFFVAGIFVGYTLKRRVRRWVSRLLKKFSD